LALDVPCLISEDRRNHLTFNNLTTKTTKI
jgi:hypothetical protein